MPELEHFCETLFGSDTGYVYSPVKDPKIEDNWIPYFFKWPVQAERLYKHVRNSSRSQEVYLAPALFGSRKVSAESFISTRSIWTEFDGETPKNLKGLPEPTIRIQSSDPGHEHWYWILEESLNDASLLELILKKVAYSLDADKSVRDVTQVLRPPTTIHHDSGKVVSRLTEFGATVLPDDFAHIKEPAVAKVEITKDSLPDPEWVIALHAWNPDTFDLFQKPEIPAGLRSTCLTRLAFDCSEMGMADSEIAAILLHADNRWKKYSNRKDQLERLIGIIRHVRTKKASEPKSDKTHDEVTTLGFADFLRTNIRIEWILEGFIPVAGQAILFGEAGCGKTSLSLRTAMAVALGKNYLTWKTLSKRRNLFVSAEMPHEELSEFFSDMRLDASLSSYLQESLFVFPLGHGFPLNHKKNQALLLEQIDKYKIEVVWIDSLSVVAGGSTSDDKTIVQLNEWVNRQIRVKRRCAVVYIHHPRKPDKLTGGFAQARLLGDLYGSPFIGANALTVVGMERKKNPDRADTAILHYAKGRYLREDKIPIICTDNRDFIVGGVKESEPRPNTGTKSSTKDIDLTPSGERLFGQHKF